MIRDNNLEVLLTIDTEVWCDGWQNIDAKFPAAFRQYILGTTPHGDYGLPFQLKVLNDNGLRAIFFVEPLFATRFGIAPLEDIVGMVTSAGHAVEMHLHSEWVDEARSPLLPNVRDKKQHICYFSYDEQCHLLDTASELLKSAGAGTLRAYRAGSFGANNDTLRALATTSIQIDSSLNPTAAPCAIQTSGPIRQPAMLDGILEVPLSIYRDGLGRLRPVQLTASSFGEIKTAMHAALRNQWQVFVVLWHSFELLNDERTHKNPIVIQRFVKLCEYLASNAEQFPTVDFSSSRMQPVIEPVHELSCGVLQTLGRVAEQARSRLQ